MLLWDHVRLIIRDVKITKSGGPASFIQWHVTSYCGCKSPLRLHCRPFDRQINITLHILSSQCVIYGMSLLDSKAFNNLGPGRRLLEHSEGQAHQKIGSVATKGLLRL